jgi:uncharacterized protein (DUF58 family)
MTEPPSQSGTVADAPTYPGPIRFRLPRAARIWLVVAVLLGFVGWYKTINLLLLAGYMMAALLAVNAWLSWRMAARLTARRLPTHPVYPGESVPVTAEVTNVGRGPVTASVTDEAGSNRAAWLIAQVPVGDTRLLLARWSFPARGRHPVGPLTADSSYPFGVVHALRVLAPPGEVVVLPPVGRVDREMFRRWLVRGGTGDGHSRRPARRPTAGHGDVRGLRPYRVGDSPREIHWRTSARRNQLLVREYDRSEPVALLLVLDPWGTPDAESARRLEWALSLATSLGQTWCEADDPAELTVIVPGTPPRVLAGPGTPGFVRQAFAPLAELSAAPTVPGVPPELLRRGTSRAARVLVSTRPASPLGESFRRAGVTFASIDPTNPPVWFTPPESAALPRPSAR